MRNRIFREIGMFSGPRWGDNAGDLEKFHRICRYECDRSKGQPLWEIQMAKNRKEERTELKENPL